jgi:hypothetical protein
MKCCPDRSVAGSHRASTTLHCPPRPLRNISQPQARCPSPIWSSQNAQDAYSLYQLSPDRMPPHLYGYPRPPAQSPSPSWSTQIAQNAYSLYQLSPDRMPPHLYGYPRPPAQSPSPSWSSQIAQDAYSLYQLSPDRMPPHLYGYPRPPAQSPSPSWSSQIAQDAYSLYQLSPDRMPPHLYGHPWLPARRPSPSWSTQIAQNEVFVYQDGGRKRDGLFWRGWNTGWWKPSEGYYEIYTIGKNEFRLYENGKFQDFTLEDNRFGALTDYIDGGLGVGDRLSRLDNFKYGKPVQRGETYEDGSQTFLIFPIPIIQFSWESGMA